MGEVHHLQAAHTRLECDSELHLQQAVADVQSEAKATAEHASSRVRKECEDGSREAMLHAIFQLQAADECVQVMRQQQLQETSACDAQRRRAQEMERRALEESKQNE